MSDHSATVHAASLKGAQRRALLQAAASLATMGTVSASPANTGGAATPSTSNIHAKPANAQERTSSASASASEKSNAASPVSQQPTQASATKKSEGKPGDFDFLAGEWRIENRRLKSPGVWDEFKSEATCWTILEGVASIEELRIPARNFSGMGIRVLDIEKKHWSDFWVNSKSGVLAPAGLIGTFVDGVGNFEADEEDGGKPIRVAGVWDRITPSSCRWRQGVSRDGGKTWEYSWFMDWKRA